MDTGNATSSKLEQGKVLLDAMSTDERAMFYNYLRSHRVEFGLEKFPGANEVFGTPELLENILCQVVGYNDQDSIAPDAKTTKTLFSAQCISKDFMYTIKGSPSLKRAMLLQPTANLQYANDGLPFMNPLVEEMMAKIGWTKQFFDYDDESESKYLTLSFVNRFEFRETGDKSPNYALPGSWLATRITPHAMPIRLELYQRGGVIDEEKFYDIEDDEQNRLLWLVDLAHGARQRYRQRHETLVYSYRTTKELRAAK